MYSNFVHCTTVPTLGIQVFNPLGQLDVSSLMPPAPSFRMCVTASESLAEASRFLRHVTGAYAGSR